MTLRSTSFAAAFRMRAIAIIVTGLLGLLSNSAFADPTVVSPVNVIGTVDRLAYGPAGRADGVILQDHSFLRFRPEALVDPGNLRYGDVIAAKGFQVLARPNRVLDRVVIQKDGKTVLDDSKPAQRRIAGVQEGLSGLQPVSQSSVLLAVGAAANGDVDQVILENGTTVRVPPGGFVDPTKLQIGEKLNVSGLGNSAPNGKFIQALSISGSDQAPLISARGGFGEKWISKSGTVKQVLLTPQGEVDGVLLNDGSTIRFYPQPAHRVVKLSPGTLIVAAGPTVSNQLRTTSVLLAQQNQVLDLLPQRNIPASGLTPLRDTSHVGTILRGPDGRVDSLVLSDGARVKVPEHLRSRLPTRLKVGNGIDVIGLGGKYAQGSAIEASSITLTG